MAVSRRISAHAYVADDFRDYRGDSRCRRCGLPQVNRCHEVNADAHAARAQMEARRLGERID